MNPKHGLNFAGIAVGTVVVFCWLLFAVPDVPPDKWGIVALFVIGLFFLCWGLFTVIAWIIEGSRKSR